MLVGFVVSDVFVFYMFLVLVVCIFTAQVLPQVRTHPSAQSRRARSASVRTVQDRIRLSTGRHRGVLSTERAEVPGAAGPGLGKEERSLV